MSLHPPLKGLKVIELAGLAPAPFTGMLLADFGADVVRVDRPGQSRLDVLCRRKRSIQIDLKSPSSKAVLEKLLRTADVLIDPFRPGVLEGLGFDLERLKSANEKLIIARLTGFRRDGKYKYMAGHDINYLATAGVLSLLGRAGDKPYAPANLLGDFAGGGLVCAFAIAIALLNRTTTGKGQVVDVNMVDGVRYLATMPMLFQHFSSPFWTRNRGTNILDGGAPFYDTYKTKDGGYMAVYLNCEEKVNVSGAIEPQFYTTLLRGLELKEKDIPDRMDQSNWSVLRQLFTEKFLEKSQSEWEGVFDGTDSCVTPIIPLSMADNRPIATLSESPALDASIANVQMIKVGTGTNEILKEWLGWRAEKDYTIDAIGTVNIASVAKL